MGTINVKAIEAKCFLVEDLYVVFLHDICPAMEQEVRQLHILKFILSIIEEGWCELGKWQKNLRRHFLK